MDANKIKTKTDRISKIYKNKAFNRSLFVV